VESHDQALVGDKTMIFRLADAAMYTDMDKACHNPTIDRAIALHKMIRLFTLAGGGEGYLNFMGNEFGHPEWIDFPREGNGWSFHYCRRQWSLKNNGFLKYEWLDKFDKDMVAVTKEHGMFNQQMADMLLMKAPEQTCAFYRGSLVFVFNFHFAQSLNNVLVPVHHPGEYTVILSSDDEKYGGFNNVKVQTYSSKVFDGKHYIELYIPARTCFVLKEKVILPPVEVTEAPAEAEAPKKAPRKRTAKKAVEAVPAAEAAVEEKPKRKRTTKKAAGEAAPVEEVVKEAPKKTTRKRTTKKAAEEN
jgi:1,4-alpha-glucan branching enzyme